MRGDLVAASACDCGRVIEQPAVGRRRVRCAVCSPKKVRPPSRVSVLAPPPAVHVPGEVESALRVVLESAGRADRYQAVLALRLARQLDSGTSVAGAQGLVSQVDQMMRAALDGVAPPADFVDDVADRRARARGAG